MTRSITKDPKALMEAMDPDLPIIDQIRGAVRAEDAIRKMGSIGLYQPAEEYIHPEMKPVVDALFGEGLEEEAHDLMALSVEYAQRLKYAARLVGHEIAGGLNE